ncbi:glycine betaine/proline transport system ATP-binding protein [Helicobacter pylori Hp A-17]|nr:glycine betaine/proline transport system ATP-binding protein [Helicobacter pylori Hp A-17]
MKEIVTIENVSFNYHNRAIFKDFNLSIEKGDFLCVLGESGSGKSTLLGLILGLLKPSLGSVKSLMRPFQTTLFYAKK